MDSFTEVLSGFSLLQFNFLPAPLHEGNTDCSPGLCRSLFCKQKLLLCPLVFSSLSQILTNNLVFCKSHVFRTSDYSHCYPLVPLQLTSPFPLASFPLSLPLLVVGFEGFFCNEVSKGWNRKNYYISLWSCLFFIPMCRVFVFFMALLTQISLMVAPTLTAFPYTECSLACICALRPSLLSNV